MKNIYFQNRIRADLLGLVIGRSSAGRRLDPAHGAIVPTRPSPNGGARRTMSFRPGPTAIADGVAYQSATRTGRPVGDGAVPVSLPQWGLWGTRLAALDRGRRMTGVSFQSLGFAEQPVDESTRSSALGEQDRTLDVVDDVEHEAATEQPGE